MQNFYDFVGEIGTVMVILFMLFFWIGVVINLPNISVKVLFSLFILWLSLYILGLDGLVAQYVMVTFHRFMRGVSGFFDAF